MGYKIREIRQEKRLTQHELAIKSGVSRAVISGLESGRCKETTVGTLAKLASALECRISDFLVQNLIY